MKKVIITLAHLLIITSLFAQSPEKMSYQAVVRDGSNNLAITTAVGMQISILQTTATGTAVYVERHFPTTNTNGLVSLEIGTGTPVSGSFSTIDWSAGPYFVKTETDLNGGANYTISGTTQLLSVPYALHAKTADNVTTDICSLFTFFYADTDNDGFGNPYNTVFSCVAPAGYISDNTDCNDNDASANTNATELCDGIDNNCDGQIDEGLSMITQYIDLDEDGYGDNNASAVQFCSLQGGYSLNNADCNDQDVNTNPGATEICGDGVDNNCDGDIDEGCCNYTYYLDADSDTYGDPNNSIQSFQNTPPTNYVGNYLDCDDSMASINISALEIDGNGIDDNCNGLIDENNNGNYVYFQDVDGDGYGGSTSIQSTSSTAPFGYTTNNRDCDDNNATIFPGAIEICGGNVDLNCDGAIPAP